MAQYGLIFACNRACGRAQLGATDEGSLESLAIADVPKNGGFLTGRALNGLNKTFYSAAQSDAPLLRRAKFIEYTYFCPTAFLKFDMSNPWGSQQATDLLCRISILR
jgi:hypothetical protein